MKEKKAGGALAKAIHFAKQNTSSYISYEDKASAEETEAILIRLLNREIQASHCR